jgi:hypothetical protein
MSKPLSEFTTAALVDETVGPEDPPMNVVLRRKAIRQLPGNQKVALYVNDALGLEVAIPYKKGEIGGRKAVAQLKEMAHDDLYGEYLHHLTKGDTRSAEHIASKVERNYGTDAMKHFRVAAKLHSEGNVAKAARHYAKFESSMHEHVEMMNEEVLGEAMLHKLRHIARSNQFGDVTFKAGAPSTRVDPSHATKVLKIWSVSSDANRRRIERMINAGHSGIQQVANFVDDHMKMTQRKTKKRK